MIVVHAAFPIKPEKKADAIERIESLVEQSNDESGVLEYHATTDIQDETVIRFFERYEDEAAFAAHSNAEHFQAFEAALPDLLAGEPEIKRFDVESATELDV